jgi:nucleoside-diphosphate-sugar epimerase
MEGFGEGSILNPKASPLSALKNARILITGASGWLGQETICLLAKTVENFEDSKIVFAASSEKLIKVHDLVIQIHALKNLPKDSKFDFILHYAFSTQGKRDILGAENYLALNRELTHRVVDLVHNNVTTKTLVLSSGAAEFVGNDNSVSESKYVYGLLKAEMEEAFSSPNNLSLRVWNTSGHHLGNDPRYAISEFISRALTNQNIEIQNNLKRSYVDSQSMIYSALSYLMDDGYGVVNSGGIETNLMDLAHEAIRCLNSKSGCVLMNTESFPSLDYVSPASDIPANYWPEEVGITDQILNTAEGTPINKKF